MILRVSLVSLCIFVAITLAACGDGSGGGGGSSSLPPTVPVASVSGAAVDGLILQGTVSAYSFTGGGKGGLLGKTTTDLVGKYSISLQIETQPVLIEVTGGYYIEEASRTRVALQDGQSLTALVNYSTGTPITVAVTPWTHVAAALARYNIGKGAGIVSAINNANNRMSQLVGVNTLTTIPADVTDVGNASATLTPELQYGFMSGAISLWTKNARPSLTLPHNPPYTSIAFVQTMYDDALNDGLLNGVAASGAISFGVTALGVNVYRHDLAINILAFAADPNNMTGIIKTQLLGTARAYAASIDTTWNNVAPIPIDTPTVAITVPSAGAWLRGSVNVTGTVNDTAGLVSDSLLMDGTSISMATTNLAAPSFSLNTSTYAEGSHTLGITVLNIAGMTGSSSISVNIDNAAPTVILNSVTAASSSGYPIQCVIAGSSQDAGSGLSTLTITLTDNSGGAASSATVQPPNGTWQVTLPHNTPAWGTATLTISHADKAGNISTISRSVYSNIFVPPHGTGNNIRCQLQ